MTKSEFHYVHPGQARLGRCHPLAHALAKDGRKILTKNLSAAWVKHNTQADEIFLSSDASRFINGQVIYVDGGILATIGKPADE